MKNPKGLVIFGSILLIVGALTPWAKVSSGFLGLSLPIYGYQTLGQLTGIAGLIFLLIGIFSKPQPDKRYSVFIAILSVIIALPTAFKFIDVILTRSPNGISTSIGFGLLCLSPLGILLAFMGAMKKLPPITPAVETAPATPQEETITK
jgi:hypothetical protein